MKTISNKKKIKMINNYNKKYPAILTMKLLNYEGNNFYISINYVKRIDAYRLSWFNLADNDSKYYMDTISFVHIPKKVINLIREDYSKIDIDLNYHEEYSEQDDDIIVLNADIKTLKSEKIDMCFKRYLPLEYDCLLNLIGFLFANMPRLYEYFYNEIIAILSGDTEKYEYKKSITFDLFNGDLNDIFDETIINRATDYYNKSKVSFLEKIENGYIALVNGTNKYIVIIEYYEENKTIKFHCTCPCEFFCKHMCAVVLAIRNKRYKPFYKVSSKNKDDDLLYKILKFNYYFCIGIKDDCLEIINSSGEIEMVDIIDDKNYCKWQIIEDDDNNSLTKKMNKYINK